MSDLRETAPELSLAEAGRLAEPFLAEPANAEHLERLLRDLGQIERDARAGGRW